MISPCPASSPSDSAAFRVASDSVRMPMSYSTHPRTRATQPAWVRTSRCWGSVRYTVSRLLPDEARFLARWVGCGVSLPTFGIGLDAVGVSDVGGVGEAGEGQRLMSAGTSGRSHGTGHRARTTPPEACSPRRTDCRANDGPTQT